eukprot:scaffold95473_cov28-Tisochrysis_lutea.AAC.1
MCEGQPWAAPCRLKLRRACVHERLQVRAGKDHPRLRTKCARRPMRWPITTPWAWARTSCGVRGTRDIASNGLHMDVPSG